MFSGILAEEAQNTSTDYLFTLVSGGWTGNYYYKAFTSKTLYAGATAVRARRIADFGLSQREIQIIRLSAEGLSAAQIAERIFLSVHTVNTHRQRIYSKMGVKNVTEMLHKADDMGLL